MFLTTRMRAIGASVVPGRERKVDARGESYSGEIKCHGRVDVHQFDELGIAVGFGMIHNFADDQKALGIARGRRNRESGDLGALIVLQRQRFPEIAEVAVARLPEQRAADRHPGRLARARNAADDGVR